jgi:ABC-2 type transport system permease protein
MSAQRRQPPAQGPPSGKSDAARRGATTGAAPRVAAATVSAAPWRWAVAFAKVLLRMTWIETKLLIREPVTLVFSFAFPVLVLVLLGGIFGGQRMNGGDYAGMKMMDWYVPSYIGLVIASIGTVSLPVHLSTYRERGVLRRYRASGVSEWALLGSQFLVGVGTCLIGALAISVLGIFAYGVVVPVSIGGVAVGFVAGVFAFSALGVLIASLAPTARAAQGVGLLIWFIMLFVSGTSAPLEQLPAWMVALGKSLPLYHVVISLVDPWNGYGINLLQATIVGGIGLATTLLAAALFRWD